MANTVVQIKRSNTTSQPANLAYGELAYSLVSNNLFIGTDSNTIIKIGGGSDVALLNVCLLYTSPSPRDKRQSRMPSSA